MSHRVSKSSKSLRQGFGASGLRKILSCYRPSALDLSRRKPPFSSSSLNALGAESGLSADRRLLPARRMSTVTTTVTVSDENEITTTTTTTTTCTAAGSLPGPVPAQQAAHDQTAEVCLNPMVPLPGPQPPHSPPPERRTPICTAASLICGRLGRGGGGLLQLHLRMLGDPGRLISWVQARGRRGPTAL